jgi:hypothetical protein
MSSTVGAEDKDAAAGPAPAPDAAQQAAPPTPESPLAIHVGAADLLIGGFMDLTSITRNAATGNGIGTNFSNFPFTSSAAGPNPVAHLNETRFSAQNSRVTLQATSKVGSASLKGYLEADFLGNTNQNLNITSNSDGLRLRLYWAQYQQGKFEFLAGQSWSFLVPGRNGLSPMPGDLFYSQNVDTNYQMGLPWQRVPGFRFIAHTSDTVALGVAIENPQQYVGGGVVLPKTFTACCLFQVDQGGSAIASASPVPNPYPDISFKVAFDPQSKKGIHQHIDAAFFFRGFKTYNPATDTSFSKTGYGGSVNFVVEPVKNFKLVATNFFSDGGGRYIANTGTPDFIVNPDYSMSLVKAWSGIYGPEITVGKTLVYGYYSVDRVTENTTLDADGKTQIGYGVTGSTAANKDINETTIGLTQTFFRDAKIGGMQLMLQYSYLKRTPFSVPAGTPSNATMSMFYLNVRYILP